MSCQAVESSRSEAIMAERREFELYSWINGQLMEKSKISLYVKSGQKIMCGANATEFKES